MNEQPANNAENNRTTGRKSKNSVAHILGGGILTERFITKQSKLLILIAILFVFFISNRYACLKKIAEIDDLKKKLENVKYEHLILSTELTANSRQSQIELLLEKRGLNLTGSKVPPFEIKH
jgi:cell division protein FtsL